MNRSESILNIAPALLKAQRKMGGAAKGSNNPFFKSKYSDYNSVLEVVKEPLNDEGIFITHHTFSDSSGHYVETVLTHETGEFISSGPLRLELTKVDMQNLGSAITYSRRYQLQALLSIPSVDDDAEATMPRTRPSDVRSVPTLTTADEAKAKVAAPVVAATGTEEKKGFRRVGGSKPAYLNGGATAPAAASASNDGDSY